MELNLLYWIKKKEKDDLDLIGLKFVFYKLVIILFEFKRDYFSRVEIYLILLNSIC